MEFDAVLFDMDGVIFDSEVKVVECWKEVADKYGIEDIETQCHACLGTTREMSRAIMLEHYGADFPYDDYKKEMSDLFHSRYGGGRLPKKAGVVELLEYLQLHNKKVAVASSTRREVVEQELRDGGLIDYFDAVICGDMVENSKPEPDIFLKACEVLGVEPARAVGVEDSYNGIRALSAAGVPAIMVPDLKAPTEEMETLAAAILPDLFAVRDYLERPAVNFADVSKGDCAMIKNVILDMGNVLLSYDPDVILNKVCETEEEKQLIRTHLFESEIWLMGDRGEIKNEERYDLAKEHLPKEMHAKLKECVEYWDICMLPIPGAMEFCHRCREAGYRIYVLSNACNHFYDYFPRHYDLEFFDGVLVSSDVHLIKPDTRIYELLCSTYDLKPEECIFIDDRPENVEAAERVGMKGIVFEGDYCVLNEKMQLIF